MLVKDGKKREGNTELHLQSSCTCLHGILNNKTVAVAHLNSTCTAAADM